MIRTTGLGDSFLLIIPDDQISIHNTRNLYHDNERQGLIRTAYGGP